MFPKLTNKELNTNHKPTDATKMLIQETNTTWQKQQQMKMFNCQHSPLIRATTDVKETCVGQHWGLTGTGLNSEMEVGSATKM